LAPSFQDRRQNDRFTQPKTTKLFKPQEFCKRLIHTNLAVANGVVYVSGDTGGKGCGDGVGNDCGAIFSLTPPTSDGGAWTQTRLYTFSLGPDGAVPEGPLTMDDQGALYGTAERGGIGCSTFPGCGTVFRLAPSSIASQPWSFSVLYRFQSAGGQLPINGVIFDKSGNLYGSAFLDYGSGKSLVFKLTPPSGAGEWKESVLYRFYPTSNCYSSGPLAVDANGAVYGVFSAYASPWFSTCNDTASEYVFRLTPSASDPNVWVKTFMHTFTSNNSLGGYELTAPVTVDSSGNVYGATLIGGYAGAGSIFVLKPRPGVPGKWNYTELFSFRDGGLGSGGAPNGGLVLAPDGFIYGTTQDGGSGERGAIYRLTK
jgi:hypothetical protein